MVCFIYFQIGPLFVFISAGTMYAVFNIGFAYYETFIFKSK